ncbi:putative PurR-regulated permease PerM [Lewinella aquimaris]|uniref:Putative PurR-regulated permease PerM n=1 Tax=Neolewinella aquimaris TaxID=1835722 RepID=A0A840E7P8_9BACT|nr:AI-2E family transporter [Neolewinella aquimaris]MBB4079645.1 putative PurR-regulated permease PerM [Neolewinella aquimaris]
MPASKLVAVVLRLALVIGIVTILYFGKPVLLTLTVGGLLAVLLDPIDEKLRSWGWKPGFAIAGAVFVLLLVFAGLFFAVGKQASRFAENWPQIEQRLGEQMEKLKEKLPMVPGGGGEDQAKQQGNGQTAQLPVGSAGGSNTTGSVMDKLPVDRSQLTGILSSTLSALGDFLLILVYVVLFLSQKERLREFVLRRAPDDKRGLTHQTINESADVAQKYLKGRLILIFILSVLYTGGFLISGLDYALVVAVLAAVLSIIPYLGNIIGGGLALAIALAGGGGTTAMVGVLVTMAIAQLLESYILTPLIVGDEVDINPLTTIVAVIAFTVLWGAVGAIVAIPVVAILRIVFSHVEGTEDYAYLLGQD